MVEESTEEDLCSDVAVIHHGPFLVQGHGYGMDQKVEERELQCHEDSFFPQVERHGHSFFLEDEKKKLRRVSILLVARVEGRGEDAVHLLRRGGGEGGDAALVAETLLVSFFLVSFPCDVWGRWWWHGGRVRFRGWGRDGEGSVAVQVFLLWSCPGVGGKVPHRGRSPVGLGWRGEEEGGRGGGRGEGGGRGGEGGRGVVGGSLLQGDRLSEEGDLVSHDGEEVGHLVHHHLESGAHVGVVSIRLLQMAHPFHRLLHRLHRPAALPFQTHPPHLVPHRPVHPSQHL